MTRLQRVFLVLATSFSGHLTLSAQNAPLPFEAESGVSAGTPSAGATQGDWAQRTLASAGATPAITYMTSLTDGGGTSPGTNNRVLSYTLTFSGPGTYDLYARVRVGPLAANDDSFFYGNGFGNKGATTASDWTSANNIFGIGYTGAAQVVDGGGAASTGVWKWMNISKYSFGGQALVTYTVPAGSLTQTFQIGAREDGLDFDKFVFGQSGLYFTVANLDAGAQGSVTPPVTFTPTGPPLAIGKPKYLGCAYSASQAPFFGNYWNAVTPENGGKWGSVESTRGTFNWFDLDAAYLQATSTGSVFRMHTLIWGAQQPAWLYNLPAADQLAAINTWFAAVAARYPKIDFIDVVNEPINTPPTGLVTMGSNAGSVDPNGGAYINALGGAGTTGYDWVITAFTMARQYFPRAKLMLNEYSVENSTTRATTYATIVNLLKTRGLIDGVGLQAHAFSFTGTATATIQGNLALLAATNLPLYATEFDIDGLADATQLAEYQRVFPLFWENPAVRGVTLWGYRPGHWRTAQGANLVNADASERPALQWLRGYIQTTVLGTRAASAAGAGIFAFPNPASGSVSLSLPAGISQQELEVQLLDALGQTVQRQTLPASAGSLRTLALPGVAKGLYTLRLQSAAGVSSQKLFVE